MKICYVNPMSYRNSALYDFNLLSNIPGDHTIDFFGNSQYDADPIPNVRFRSVFKYSNCKSSIMKAASYSLSILKLIVACKKNKPDVIHIQWIKFPFIDTLLLRFAKSRHIRVIYTAHNVLPHDDEQRRQFNTYKKYYDKLSDIIVHTQATKQELITDFGVEESKIHVIPHGLIEIKNDETKVNEIISELKESIQGKIIFSSLGFQLKYKGIHLISKLWAEEPSIRNNENIHLIIAGKKDAAVTYTEIENLPNVTIIDRYIDDNEYVAFSRITDVMLMPYLKISQSGVLIAAINEHVPILVSHVGGLPDPLAVANVGWDIGEPNYSNLRKTILQIISSPESIRQIKKDEESWLLLSRFYSWEAIGKKTEMLYSNNTQLFNSIKK